jgi:hypothetical protein
MRLCEVLQRTVPRYLYHTVDASYQAGQPLLSLYSQHGGKAYDIFAKRWPQGKELGEYHAHYVFMYDTAREALEHVVEHGGKVVKIKSAEIPDVRFDDLEQPGHWVARDEIPPEAICAVTPTISPGASQRVLDLALSYLNRSK